MGKSKEPAPVCTIVDMYHSICVSYPRLVKVTDSRKKAMRSRWAEYEDIDKFVLLFSKAEASTFLKGTNGRGWKATFDWLLNPTNMVKVLEGNYDNSRDANGGQAQTVQEKNRNSLQAMLEQERLKEAGQRGD